MSGAAHRTVLTAEQIHSLSDFVLATDADAVELIAAREEPPPPKGRKPAAGALTTTEYLFCGAPRDWYTLNGLGERHPEIRGDE